MVTAHREPAGSDAALARLIKQVREADARENLRHLRNVLSVVRVLARRTADETDELDEFLARFDGRLAAFARVQSAAGGDGRDLHAMIGDELLAFGMGVGDRVRLDGPPVRLVPRAAGLVALAIHEMVVDHATADGRGSARVAWSGGEGLDIDWVEPLGDRDDPSPLAHWVEQAIAYQLGGELTEEHDGSELRRRIRLPAACVRFGGDAEAGTTSC